MVLWLFSQWRWCIHGFCCGCVGFFGSYIFRLTAATTCGRCSGSTATVVAISRVKLVVVVIIIITARSTSTTTSRSSTARCSSRSLLASCLQPLPSLSLLFLFELSALFFFRGLLLPQRAGLFFKAFVLELLNVLGRIKELLLIEACCIVRYGVDFHRVVKAHLFLGGCFDWFYLGCHCLGDSVVLLFVIQ